METTKEDKPLESSGEEKAATEKTTKKMGEIPKSNTDDSGDIVLVEAEDLDQPQAVQIVSIGTAEDAYAFTFHKEKMEKIINCIPGDTKVSVVSVVGAFRTGKSFLLCWFLQYLHYLQKQEENGDNAETTNVKWYEEVKSLKNDGFHWRAGSERNTTGIWMWSHPHILKKQNLAVLLVDTQGMFDNETTMSLTASIFGLSTLLSSYQIYNVDKMIQEDNLQHLALFSEYARAAMANKQEKEGDKPFQHIEFLVRDWQHFEEEEDFDEMVKEMEGVLEKVMQSRDANDLQETRDQIKLCFQDISCYGLPHPGFAVTKRSYKGEVDKIEAHFLELLGRYCPRVFDNLAAKVIHGRELTGKELTVYIEKYAEMFASGASFPEASTMLEATASANNTNAANAAIKNYEEHMEKIAGHNCSNYVEEEKLKEDHMHHRREALEVFEFIANFGSKKSIEKSKENLKVKIEDSFEKYRTMNKGRKPNWFPELLVPSLVAMVTWLFRTIMDGTCSAHVCQSSSELLSHAIAVMLCFVVLVGITKAKEIGDSLKKLKQSLQWLLKSENTVATVPAQGTAKAKTD